MGRSWRAFLQTGRGSWQGTSVWSMVPLSIAVLATCKIVRTIPWVTLATILFVIAIRVRLRIPRPRLSRSAKEGECDELGAGGRLSMDAFEDQAKRRSLVIGSVALLCYLLGGFWFGHSKGWGFTDVCYFVIVTFSTVGYGDQTFGGSAMELISGGAYVLIGVAFIGSIVGEAALELQVRAERAAERLQAQRRTAGGEEAGLERAPRSGVEKVRAEMGEMRELRRKLAWAIVEIVVVVLAGSEAMVLLEGWSFGKSFLWACATATTVGYGDIVPVSAQAKWFSILYILASFTSVAVAIGRLASMPVEAHRIQSRARVLMQFGDSLEAEELQAALGSEELRSLRALSRARQAEEKEAVSRAEFVLWLLLKQRKLHLKADVAPCGKIFDSLDPDGSGFLDQADIDLFARRREQEQRAAATVACRDEGPKAEDAG